MATNKGGRPRRAPGERLKKVSISIRSVALECVDLIARQRRTSISQAIEHVALLAGGEYSVGGYPVVSIAQKLADLPECAAKGYIRIYLLPEELRTSYEDFVADVVKEIGLEKLSSATGRHVSLLGELIRALSVADVQPIFVAETWPQICTARDEGQKVFTVTTDLGFEYVFTFDAKQSQGPK